jgi:hypothetical protein
MWEITGFCTFEFFPVLVHFFSYFYISQDKTVEKLIHFVKLLEIFGLY